VTSAREEAFRWDPARGHLGSQRRVSRWKGALSWGLQEEDGWGRVRGHSGGMNIEGFRVVNPRLLQSSLERIDNSGPEIRLPHDHERRIWWVVQLGRGEITLQPSWASHWDFRNCLKTREPGASDSKTWKSLDQI